MRRWRRPSLGSSACNPLRPTQRMFEMDYQSLQIEIETGVATVWMNRPERHNAFDETLIEELTAAFAQLDQDPTVRAVVLAGRGKSFSAGADLNWMRKAASYSPEENLRDARALAGMLRAIHGLSKPTVARVHEVCAPERLDEPVKEVAAALLSGGPKAQTAAKELIRAVVHRSLD